MKLVNIFNSVRIRLREQNSNTSGYFITLSNIFPLYRKYSQAVFEKWKDDRNLRVDFTKILKEIFQNCCMYNYTPHSFSTIDHIYETSFAGSIPKDKTRKIDVQKYRLNSIH